MDRKPLEYGSYPVILCTFPMMQCLCYGEAILELDLPGSGRQPFWNQAEQIPMVLVPRQRLRRSEPLRNVHLAHLAVGAETKGVLKLEPGKCTSDVGGNIF